MILTQGVDASRIVWVQGAVPLSPREDHHEEKAEAE
jgi:hypothetical protein